jgi:transcriptional regulator with XRE-family HTH domain
MQQKCTLFPERLAELRETAQLTRQQLADKLGISRASLEYYEKGKRKPDIEVLYKISECFNVTADYLIGRTDKRGANTKINSICEYTGLSESAINELNTIKQLSEKGYTDDDNVANKCIKNDVENNDNNNIDLFINAVKIKNTNYLSYLSHLIEDYTFDELIAQFDEYISNMNELDKLENIQLSYTSLQNDILFTDCKEKADFSLFKLSKYTQKVANSLYLKLRGDDNANNTQT